MAENNTVKYNHLAKDASKTDPRAILEMLNMRKTDQQLLTLTLKKENLPIIETEELQVRLLCLGGRLTHPVTKELVSKHVKTESFRYRDKHKSIIHLVFHTRSSELDYL